MANLCRYKYRIFTIAFLVLTWTIPAMAQFPQMYGGVANGSPVNVGFLLLVDQEDGTGTTIGAGASPIGLSGIAANSAGELFGSTIAGPITTSTLVQIDPNFGVVIDEIGDITDSDTDLPISIGDLAFEPVTDVLFGIRSNTDGQDMGGLLYTIDPDTGIASLVGDTGIETSGGLAFGPGGILFLTDSDGNLNIVDPADGSIVSTQPIPSSNFYDGLGFNSADGLLYASPAGMDDGVFTIDPLTGVDTLVGNTGAGVLSDLDFLIVNVSIEKGADTNSVRRNRETQITYTIEIESDGDVDAFDVIVTDELPDGAIIEILPAGCIEPILGVVECDVGMLPIGEARSFDIVISITPQGSQILNEAIVNFLNGENSDGFIIKVRSGAKSGCGVAVMSEDKNSSIFSTLLILMTPGIVVGLRYFSRRKKVAMG